LHILPLSQQHSNEEQTIIKVSDNQVILSAVPNAPIFPFSHVLDMNTQDHYLFDTIPQSVISELVQGTTTSFGYLFLEN
jgi:hypothetical protein